MPLWDSIFDDMNIDLHKFPHRRRGYVNYSVRKRGMLDKTLVSD